MKNVWNALKILIEIEHYKNIFKKALHKNIYNIYLCKFLVYNTKQNNDLPKIHTNVENIKVNEYQ